MQKPAPKLLIESLKSYNDLRRLFSPPIFRATMHFLAWHNRLSMTAMLEMDEAVTAACILEHELLDEFSYPRMKQYLDSIKLEERQTLSECRHAAGRFFTEPGGTLAS